MSRNYYSEIHLHIVWHTKESYPMLTPAIEPQVHQNIRQRIIDTDGAFVHEIGGTENHVHVCMSIPPTLTISEFIGQLKGGSSHDINHSNPTRDKLLQWQTGYGVVSFGTKNMEWVKKYVRNQKEHHAKKTIEERLERITQLED